MKRIATILAVTAFAVADLSAVADDPKPDAEGWIALFNGKDTSGWRLRHGDKNGWSAQEGVLVNKLPSADIISGVPQGDFELHVEFMVPKGSNSGVYLQGRYEIQVDDSFGMPADSHHTGGIYGRVNPKANAAKPAGEWQSFDVVFHQAELGADGKVAKKSRVTVIHNGQKIIEDAEIDGPTGAAVDVNEGKPAGLMLQGDHGPVSFRNIKMRPLKADKPAAKISPLPEYRFNGQSFDAFFHQAEADSKSKKYRKARVTVVRNGTEIIKNAAIEGLTGSVEDGNADLMLRGDHGKHGKGIFLAMKMWPLNTEKPDVIRVAVPEFKFNSLTGMLEITGHQWHEFGLAEITKKP